MTLKRFFIALVAAVLSSATAHAHDSRIIVIDVKAVDLAHVDVAWRVPETIATQLLDVQLGPGCRSQGSVQLQNGTPRKSFSCSTEPSDIDLLYSQFAPPLATLVRVEWGGQNALRATFPAGATHLTLPSRETFFRVLNDYTRLGFEHILGGWDHLLFVLGLFSLAMESGRWRRLILAITGFTLGHSASLAAGVFGILKVNIAAVETLIAMSLVVLAVELTRRSQDSWSRRYPLLMSSAFGLLHGVGFASALTEIGLPQSQAVTALISFNLGVEGGQLAFIGLLTIASMALRTLSLSSLARPAILSAYCIGIPAAFWTFERAVGTFGL